MAVLSASRRDCLFGCDGCVTDENEPSTLYGFKRAGWVTYIPDYDDSELQGWVSLNDRHYCPDCARVVTLADAFSVEARSETLVPADEREQAAVAGPDDW
jgi:hypothetical protein